MKRRVNNREAEGVGSMTSTDPKDSPAGFMSEVIREAIECDRAECLPESHTRYVTENMKIAQEENDGNR